MLLAELMIMHAKPGPAEVVTVQRIDLWYGILAAAILALGFLRAIFAAKGWAYYEHNIWFWAKVATFLVIGGLSVPPTVLYLRWRNDGVPPGPSQAVLVRRLLWAQVGLFALLPVFAAAMARSYGEIGS